MFKTRFAIFLMMALCLLLLTTAAVAGCRAVRDSERPVLAPSTPMCDVTQQDEGTGKPRPAISDRRRIGAADPDRGVVKVLRIFARGPNGNERMFEYRENSALTARSSGAGAAANGAAGVGVATGMAGGDAGQFVILSAQYGTARSHVDVTARLKQLARTDQQFRMGNRTFGVDPDPGVVKVLRIFARGPNGRERMFEYRENSIVNGAQFRSWGGANGVKATTAGAEDGKGKRAKRGTGTGRGNGPESGTHRWSPGVADVPMRTGPKTPTGRGKTLCRLHSVSLSAETDCGTWLLAIFGGSELLLGESLIKFPEPPCSPVYPWFKVSMALS